MHQKGQSFLGDFTPALGAVDQDQLLVRQLL